MQECVGCHRQLNKQQFYGRFHEYPWCKNCHQTETHKFCTLCQQPKLLDCFHRNRQFNNRLYAWCKECTKKVNSTNAYKKRHSLNPDKCKSCGSEKGNIVADVDKEGNLHGYLCTHCYRILLAANNDHARAQYVSKYIVATRGRKKGNS